MTSTSGPGLSLMTEGIGHAGAAEVPVVVADCQRVGPSTGEPTRHEQSDIAHLAHLGHGEFPRVLLAPGTVEDCFYITIDALNIAEKWRLPVILVLDQALCQNSSTVPSFDLTHVRVDRGRRLTPEGLAATTSYKYYELTPDGQSAYAPPGTPGVTSQVTGNEHDEFGHVSVNPVNRVKMMHKRMEKLHHLRSDLPLSRTFGDPNARLGLIGFGSTFGPIREAQEILLSKGVGSRFFQARSLFPVPTEELQPFLSSLDRVYVVEHNYNGQFAGLIRGAMPEFHAKLRSVRKFDGHPFRAPEIVRAVEEA